MTDREEIREQLAAIEHERWADWQTWCHKILRANIKHDIEPTLARWEKQIATPYSELTREEQLSDLEQVDRYWPLIEALLIQARKQVVEEVLGLIGDNEYGNIGYDGEEMVNETTDEMLTRNELRATLREEIGKLGASEVAQCQLQLIRSKSIS